MRNCITRPANYDFDSGEKSVDASTKLNRAIPAILRKIGGGLVDKSRAASQAAI
jgi:hypothetical protein